MAFDFKKEYRELYLPKESPSVVTVPPMNFIAVRGSGDPNREDGEYRRAVGLLYGIAYTIKMSKKGNHPIDGYFDYVVPPLEGLWRQEGVSGVDYGRKDAFQWISMIRLPDFVTEDDFIRAAGEASWKKNEDFSDVRFFRYDEGLCVQCLHTGPYDEEPETVRRMNRYMEEQGYVPDFTDRRLHHEIYLSDPRKTAPEKLRTVIRHPVRRIRQGGGEADEIPVD